MAAGAVLVTGGSRGIGRAVVELLAARGLPVAFTWRRDDGAARAVEQACGPGVRAFPLDLEDVSRPAELVREVEAEVGPLSGLVTCAGVLRESLLAMTPDDEWSEVVDTNLGGVFRCCRAVLPGMVRRRSGSIVTVASLSASHGLPGQAAYAASKAGIVGLTRVLAREVGRRGVRANAVVPGYVETDMTAGLPEERRTALRASECLPGGVAPDAVARAIAFLLSDEASAITGQALVVDAGASA